MLTNIRRRYMLGIYTVEHYPDGWKFCQSGYERQRDAWSRPYSSISSVTLMIARRLRKEVERRDKSFNAAE